MNIVGTSKPIHDAKGKVMGSTKYAGDFVLPNMLHAALIYSTIPHGYVKSIDDSKVREMDGVVDVLHCFNTTDRAYNRYRTIKGQKTMEQDHIFQQHVRFVGDKIGCVLAETAALAKKAAKEIKIQYEALPFTTDVEEALQGKISMIHPEGAVYSPLDLEFGDKSAVQNDAIETVTESYLPRITHMAMETHCCVAHWDAGEEFLTIWCPNQSVHGIRTVIADLFDLSYERVRVVKTTMGGSFGGKQEWILEPIATAATLKTERPVKLVLDRGETMVSTISRAPIHGRFKTRILPNGKIQSMDLDVILNSGGYVGNACDYLHAISSKFFRCYRYPYAHYTAKVVCTNAPMSGAYRGWSAPEMYTMMEHNLNMAARKLRMDPLELRLQNTAMPGDVDLKSGLPLGEIRIRECLLLGREKFAWDKRREENKSFNARCGRYLRGMAVGCAGHVNGYYPRFPDYAGVSMRVTETGGVQVAVSLHDHGCGTVTAMQMIAAQVLHIPVTQIIISEGDTAYTPHDVGCFASRTTYVIGRAVMDCAEKLRETIFDTCVRYCNAERHTLSLRDGAVFSGDTLCVTLSDLATWALQTEQKELWIRHQGKSESNPGVTGAHFAWVEVDTYTGMVSVLDYLAVHDIGRAINREIVIAQIQGAVAMGCGAALSESMQTSEISGKTTNSMKDYHVKNAPDVPTIRVELIEDGQTQGPFGAKSIGEVCYVPVAAAVIGAVNDALSSELGHLPLSPDTIVAYLMEGK